jgi:hypothetical protein
MYGCVAKNQREMWWVWKIRYATPQPRTFLPLIGRRSQVVIDQQDAPGTPSSLLDHLRHLFAIDPELEGQVCMVVWLPGFHLPVDKWWLLPIKRRNKNKIRERFIRIFCVCLRILTELQRSPHQFQASYSCFNPASRRILIETVTLVV